MLQLVLFHAVKMNRPEPVILTLIWLQEFHCYIDKNNKKKTFPIKMKEDVGMSKLKKHVNKVRWNPK